MKPDMHPIDFAQETAVREQPRVVHSLSGVRRLRSDESWIEVSSQPSSSSVSSAAADDANPAVLGVQFDQYGRRRRRLLRTGSSPASGLPERRPSLTGASSQEEYEESESESDRIMTSSNENIENQLSNLPSPQGNRSPHPRPRSGDKQEDDGDDDDDDDDDENATALGIATDPPAFTPPPNAFSHPTRRPTIDAHHRSRTYDARASYLATHQSSSTRRNSAHSYPNRGSRNTHSPYDLISSHQPDHDAALRASLSTLLSCAAAARGLPKKDERYSNQQLGSNMLTSPSNCIEPSALRLVPESALPIHHPPQDIHNPQGTPQLASEHPPQLPPRPRTSSTTREKSKRKASPSSKDRNGAAGTYKKKVRAHSPPPQHNESSSYLSAQGVGTEFVQPTLMTWVVSAGVVILFSAISFSAGYAIGREVGRLEAGGSMREEGIVCGREVGKGLRRLRWGSGAAAGGLSVIRTS